MGFCVFVCAVYVCCWDFGCEFAMEVPSIESSAAALCVRFVSECMCVFCEDNCV